VSVAPPGPYLNFRFRLKMGSRYVAGVTKVSGLSRIPPSGEFSNPIVLERGVSYDYEFVQWANRIWDHASKEHVAPTPPLKNVRRDILIDGYDEAGTRVFSYAVHDCWPSEFAANSELDGMGNAVVIESLVLQNSGWELVDPSSGSVTPIPGS
jgi:phage tail-like protein